MTTFDENYDVYVGDYDRNRIKRLQYRDSLFKSPPDGSIGVEAWQQLLPPTMRLARPFRLRRSRTEYNKHGMLLRQMAGTALLPLVSTPTEIGHVVKLLFGTDLYKRMMYNYIFPRRTIYRNPIVPGSKRTVITNNIEEYSNIVKGTLPKLTTKPSYMIKTLKNTIFDFSDVLKYTLPNKEMCMRPIVLQTSTNLILQSILRLGFSVNTENSILYSQYTSTLPPIYEQFKNIIIPFHITTHDMRVPNLYLDPNVKINSNIIKKDPELSSTLGILRFVLKCIGEFPLIDPVERLLGSYVKNDLSHVVFVFYNDTHAFYVDYGEFKAKSLKYESIYRMVKTSLKLLISLNAGSINDDDISELENKILVADDADSDNIEKEVDSKILKEKRFDDDLINKVNAKTSMSHPKVIQENIATKNGTTVNIETIEKGNRIAYNATNETELKNILEENDKSDKTLDLLIKAQKDLQNEIDLGHTSMRSLMSQKQTPISALTKSKDLSSVVRVNDFVNKVKMFEAQDDESDDNVTGDDISEWIDDDDEEEGDTSNTEDIDDIQDDTQEDDEDDIPDSEDEDTDEDEDDEDDDDVYGFINNDKKKKEEDAKKAVINHVRETIEGKVTDKQKKYYDSIKDKYKSIKFDDKETLEDVLNRANTISIEKRDEKLPLAEKTLNVSTLKDFTKNYVKKTMAQDIVANVKAFSDENKSNQMAITGFTKEDISDQFNSVERYKFELKDKFGKSHSITFKMPKVDEDGFMYLGGNRKLIKKQWILKPVSKTSPDDVYIVSNYNKCHIFREGLMVNKTTESLDKFLSKYYLNPERYPTLKIYKGNNTKVNKDHNTTIEYDFLAAKLNKIVIYDDRHINVLAEFIFSQKEIRQYIDDNNLKFDKNGTLVPIGISNGQVITVDPNDQFSSASKIVYDTLSNLAGQEVASDLRDSFVGTKGDSKKMKSSIEVQSFKVPLIIFMSSIFGFNTVLEKSHAKWKFISKDTKKSELDEETLKFISEFEDTAYIKFMDGTFYYKQHPIDEALLLNGLKDIGPSDMEFEELNHIETYIEYTFRKFNKRTLIKGWTAFKDLFLDPKTLEVINALHLPSDLCELLLYANSLLQNNQFNFSGGVSSWRIRDYEILTDLMYQSISQNYAKYMQKGKSREGFSIPEDDVLIRLNKSMVLVNYDSTSPINEMREKGSITYKGPNGINLDRAFSIDKRGVIEETIGTVDMAAADNGSVGINKQLTANPRIINTLGFVEPTKNEELDKISSSSLYAYEISIPYGQYNDPRRVGFISSQTKHVVPAAACDVPVVGTGMEKVLPYKVSDQFGYKAKQDGRILKVDDNLKYLIIEYKDGTTDRVEYGGKYMKNSDFFLANNLEINVKEGQKVKEGEIVTYNKDYFKRHMGKLIFAQGPMARVCIDEGEVTEDDSSGISYRLAKKLATTIVKRKQVVLNYNANIVSCVKVGDHVVYGDDLMVYEDTKDADADMALLSLLGDADEDILNTIARHGASANYTGTIKDIKVYWTVDPDLLGESTRKFVKQYINKLMEDIKQEEALTGKRSQKRIETQVSKPMGSMKDRINGCFCPKDGCVIVEFYIEHTADRRPGDKVSLMPALKSVINKVMDKETCAYRINNKSKFNTIDYIQGNIGVNARMTVSQYYDGYLSKVIIERGKQIAASFLDEIK